MTDDPDAATITLVRKAAQHGAPVPPDLDLIRRVAGRRSGRRRVLGAASVAVVAALALGLTLIAVHTTGRHPAGTAGSRHPAHPVTSAPRSLGRCPTCPAVPIARIVVDPRFRPPHGGRVLVRARVGEPVVLHLLLRRENGAPPHESVSVRVTAERSLARVAAVRIFSGPLPRERRLTVRFRFRHAGRVEIRAHVVASGPAREYGVSALGFVLVR